MKRIILLLAIVFGTSNLVAQRSDFKISLGYMAYEDDFFVNSFAQKNDQIPSPHGDLKILSTITYSYYPSLGDSWFFDIGVSFAYRSVTIGEMTESGFSPFYDVDANYLDLSPGLGYEFRINRLFSIAPKVNIGFGLPLQGETPEVTGPIRNNNFNYNNPVFFSSTGVCFKLNFNNKRGKRWWVGIEPRFLTFFNNMYKLEEFPLATNEAPHFAGGFDLHLGYSFW